ncbi:MAG: PilN domain-containing protein [Alphaproteobacteria bacterium]|nr:PilN domain-containing protein [Alphaproteobacteria bacterium]
MVREFFEWWLGQLASLLPEAWRGAGPKADDALVIAPIGPLGQSIDGFAVSLRRNGTEIPQGRFGIEAAGWGEVPRPAGTPAVLRLSGGEVLSKTLTLPLAAERELDQVLAFEMDRETPFKAEELYWNRRIEARDRQNGRLSVRLLLIPKTSLAPLLAALERVGIAPARAEIADGPDRDHALPLSVEARRRRMARGPLIWPTAACCAALAAAAIIVPFVRQGIAMAAVDRQIATARSAAAEADTLRREIEHLSANADLVDSERDKAGRPLEALAALTRILPDDTFLTEMILRQHKLTLTGRSGAAARLIGALSAGGEFRNPAFAAPVTRLDTPRSELFTITAEAGP